MAAQYDLYENPDPSKSGKPQLLHARFVPSGKVTARRFCELAAEGNTFNPMEMQGMLECIIDTLIEQLKEGKVVELGSLGTVSMTLTCRRPAMKKNEIRSNSVRVKNLSFTLFRRTKQRIKDIRLEHKPQGWQSRKVSAEVMEKRLTDFFASHPVMISRDYCRLRECKPGKGLRELNALIEEGRLIRQGRRAASFYIPAEGNFGR